MTEPQTPTPDSDTLLPPFLAGAPAFFWFWALPAAVLLALNVQSFALISGNLDPTQTTTALLIGLGNVINVLVAAGLGVQALRWSRAGRNKLVGHFGWSLLVIAMQAGYLWAATVNANDMLPRSVTAWIFPEARYFFNQYAFSMLPLFFGILRLAGMHAKKGARSIITGLLMTLLPPGVLYLFLTIVMNHSAGNVAEVIFGVLLVVMGALMFTGVIRLTLLVLRAIRTGSLRAEFIAILILGVILPLCGLALNRDTPFPTNLQAPEVYALVIVNALLLAMACGQRTRRPLLSMALLCATLPYSLYFFLVFLPFTPLAILAIIAFGLGFLILTPTFLFTLHLHLLNSARQALPSDVSRRRIALVCLGSFLILPAAFTVRALADRIALNSALDYVFTPSITTGDMRYGHSLTNLRRALNNHRDYKDGLYYPFLSDAYAWLVFDNLVLPDAKLDRIDMVFFGDTDEAPQRARNNNWGFFGSGGNRARNSMPRAVPPPRDVSLTDWALSPSTTNSEGALSVTLRLQLEVPDLGRPSEYITHLPLPAGVFVNGFRLQVNGELVPGRITEKKTALWVYEMIRDTERRDPGLLFHNDNGGLELRVFPVIAGTPSVVEIDFLLPPQTSLSSLDEVAADPAASLNRLGEAAAAAARRNVVSANNVAVMPVPPIDLPAAPRKSYLHLIVDRSQDNAFDTSDWPAVIQALNKAYPEATQARLTLANHSGTDLLPELTDLSALQQIDTAQLKPSGALALDLVLARAIRRHRDDDLDLPPDTASLPPRPIFVILGQKAPESLPDMPITRTWTNNLPGLEIAAMDATHTLKTLTARGLTETPLLRLGGSTRPVVAGRPVEFVAQDSGESDVRYWSTPTATWEPLPEARFTTADSSPWTRAVMLTRRQQAHLRNPGSSDDSLGELVTASREAGVLVKSTSYIVVENDAQWRALEKAEEQKLGQHDTLEHKEAPAPALIWVIAPFACWMASRRRPRSVGTGDEDLRPSA